MREFKFRVWHKGAKEMLFENISGDVFKWYHEHQDIEIMQFTGLLDKNGKEIYEGDIVKILYTDWISKSHDDPRTIDQYKNDIAKKGTIEYNTDGFYFVTLDRYGDKNYSHILPGTHGFIEIIGNIFQNSELLNQ